MKILVTIPKGITLNTFIPNEVKEKLKKLGEVEWNNSELDYSREILHDKLCDVDVIITGWGTKKLDKYVLENAVKLKVIAHTGGSVASIVDETAYNMGIKVVSGNLIYAESVSEGALAYILASLRDIPLYDKGMHEGKWAEWDYYNEGLFDQTIGLVSYGTVAKFFVKMLMPFRTKIKVYSRSISQDELEKYNMERASLEEIFSTCKIISLHTAYNEKTHHMIDSKLIKMIPNGSILMNTARGGIIDEYALEKELKKKRFKAVLDVFEEEPLPVNSGLRKLSNVILIPHMCGPTVDRRKYVTLGLIDDIQGYYSNKQLKYEIPKSLAVNMTK